MNVSMISGARRGDRHYARDTVRVVTAGLTHVLPSHIASEVAIELGFSARRALYSRTTRRRLAALDGCRVNVGCGYRPTPGWVNIELKSTADFYFWDCRRGLPFSDNRVTAIYSEHVFEHFDPETDATLFLRECLRCLRPGGVLRIVVPDAGAYLRAYGQSWERLAAISQLEQTQEGWREKRYNYKGIINVYRTQMQLINEVFRQGNQHKYAYDEETLVLVLRDAGFSRVIRQSFGISLDQDMAPDNETRRAESLYVEAVK
jgi:predicted SAM-dependent methyltransferase